jgi:hypothetical protein
MGDKRPWLDLIQYGAIYLEVPREAAKYLRCVNRDVSLPITQQECDLCSKQDSQCRQVSRNIVAYSGLYAHISQDIFLE